MYNVISKKIQEHYYNEKCMLLPMLDIGKGMLFKILLIQKVTFSI